MLIEKKDWSAEFQGKKIYSLRPRHEGSDPVPYVDLVFTDRTSYVLRVKDGVFFESCLLNTLRRATEIVDIVFDKVDDSWNVEFWADTFPLFMFYAVNKEIPNDQFPFELSKREV